MRISDWSSDVCSSDLIAREDEVEADAALLAERRMMELVRLHEPLRIAASRHPAEIALMDEPVVHPRIDDAVEIGRASCRGRVWQAVVISVVRVRVKKQNQHPTHNNNRNADKQQ